MWRQTTSKKQKNPLTDKKQKKQYKKKQEKTKKKQNKTKTNDKTKENKVKRISSQQFSTKKNVGFLWKSAFRIPFTLIRTILDQETFNSKLHRFVGET